MSSRNLSLTLAGSLFVVFLIHPLVSGNSCEDTGFHPDEKGQYLQHHVIDTMTTQTVSLCRIMCYLQESCRSYNYQLSTGSCQLSDTDETDEGHVYELISSDDHIYVRRVNPCENVHCSSPKVCKPNFKDGSHSCSCPPRYYVQGSDCQVLEDCSQLLSAGYTKDGVYHIDPDGQGSFPVYCDMTTDGGGWTVFQRNRKDSLTSFNRGWQEYKTGFGNLTGEFWLGLEKIHRLIKTQAASLRVDLEDQSGNKKYAVYSSFSIAHESDFYRLHVSGYSGTAGDSIGTSSSSSSHNNNMRFSTPDRDNDAFLGSCAAERRAGWWYNYCTISDLNGSKVWSTFTGSLMNTEMKLNDYAGYHNRN